MVDTLFEIDILQMCQAALWLGRSTTRSLCKNACCLLLQFFSSFSSYVFISHFRFEGCTARILRLRSQSSLLFEVLQEYIGCLYAVNQL